MNENALLDLLESQEAEADARDAWVAEWVEANHQPLLEGKLDIDVLTLIGEVNHDQYLQLSHAFYLLMTEGDASLLMQSVSKLMDEELEGRAVAAWDDHLAELEDAMSEAQFEQYLQRSAA